MSCGVAQPLARETEEDECVSCEISSDKRPEDEDEDFNLPQRSETRDNLASASVFALSPRSSPDLV